MDTTPTHSRRRRTRVGVRGMIAAVGAAGMLAAATVGGFAIAGLDDAGDSRGDVRALDSALSHTQQIEFYNADVSGWQTAYAWDARRIGGAAAVRPDNANRAGFLTDADALKTELGKMPVDALTAEEAADYAKIRQNWDTFFVLDDKVV